MGSRDRRLSASDLLHDVRLAAARRETQRSRPCRTGCDELPGASLALASFSGKSRISWLAQKRQSCLEQSRTTQSEGTLLEPANYQCAERRCGCNRVCSYIREHSAKYAAPAEPRTRHAATTGWFSNIVMEFVRVSLAGE